MDFMVSSNDDNVIIVEAATAGPSVKIEVESVPFVSKLSLNKKRKAENVEAATAGPSVKIKSENVALARELYDQE
jgi:hypothetical protein